MESALLFAGKAASYRAQTGTFPTAAQVAAAQFPVSAEGQEQITNLPEDFLAVSGYTIDVRNPVGLGDTWTCSFSLSLLGGT